jgi:transmembrane sensor
MKAQDNTSLIIKVLAKEANAREVNDLETWKNSSSENAALAAQLEQIWINSQIADDTIDVDTAWLKVSNKINAKKSKIFQLTFFKIAATLLVTGIVGLLINIWIQATNTQTIYTAAQEIKQITLPDGSVVWLNQNSNLQYHKEFNGNTREVKLNGEAFFEVQKNKNKPFIISSKQSTTQVLGTSFNLVAYDSANEVELSVKTGQVSFTANQNKQQIIVNANERAIINKEAQAPQKEIYNNNALAWQNKELTFNNTLFSEVAKTLAHSYNVKISISNTRINNCHFTGEFKNASFQNVMETICKTLQLVYEQEENKVTIKGEGCQ